MFEHRRKRAQFGVEEPRRGSGCDRGRQRIGVAIIEEPGGEEGVDARIERRRVEAVATAVGEAGESHRRLAQLYLQKGDQAGAALHTKEADKLEKGQK